MKSLVNDLPDPSVCSCFSSTGSYFSICKKFKWSTLSISIALLIIIFYLSSGLYALIDVTTITAAQSMTPPDDTTLWPIASSSWLNVLGWISVSVYLIIVVLVTILLCGIQLNKPWLLLLWSIIMVFMLLIDGIVTILSLREHQQQNYRSSPQVKILFVVMTVRLIISLIGICISIFHFRRITKANSNEKNRQKILDRYNGNSPTPSYHESWARPVGSFPSPAKDYRPSADPSPPLPLPRAKMSIMKSHPTSTMFHTYTSPLEFIDHPHQRPLNNYQDDFRYNIPLQERFHQNQMKSSQGF